MSIKPPGKGDNKIEERLAKQAAEKKKKTTAAKKTSTKKVTTKKKKTVATDTNVGTKKNTTKKAPKKTKQSTTKKSNTKTTKSQKGKKQQEEQEPTIPGWFLDLFSHLDKVDGIDVSAAQTNSNNKKQGVKELERKLFLIFYASPRIVSLSSWSAGQGNYSRLGQKDFAAQAHVAENTLIDWKKQDWFTKNLPIVMRKIFASRTPDVLDSLYIGTQTKVNEWGKRDSGAIKLWLQYIEEFMPGEKRQIEGDPIAVMFGDGSIGKSQFINKAEKKDDETETTGGQ